MLTLIMIPSVLVILVLSVYFLKLRSPEYIDFLCSDKTETLFYLQKMAPHFLILFLLLNGLTTFLTLLIYSNRIFGPIHHIKKRLQKLKEEKENSDFHPIRVRELDEFSDLAELLNSVILKLKP